MGHELGRSGLAALMHGMRHLLRDPVGGGIASPQRLTVGSSNDITPSGWSGTPATIYGKLGGVAAITSVPLAVPASLTAIYTDGLVAVRNESNGGSLEWAAGLIDDGTDTHTGVTATIPANRTAYALASISINIGAGPTTAPVWLIAWLQ